MKSVQTGPPAIVEAALNSTRAYLEFLEEQERGIERHRAARIGSGVGAPDVAEGRPVLLYRFEVDRRLRLTPDTAVRFIPDGGESPQDVLIHAYDFKTGLLDLAFPKSVEAPEGTLEISFRWLVERVEHWLEERGDRIVDPGKLELPPRAPAIDDLDAVFSDRSLFPVAPSPSQVEAVAAAIRRPFSYTWGPPGSGKTDFALAGAACAMVRRGLKILILAPTNLAVENALRAVLRRFRNGKWDDSRVLRLGLPTPDFLRDYPDRCEDHSVRAELGALRVELESLKVREAARVEREEITRELEAIETASRKRVKSKVLGKSGKLATIREALSERLAALGPAPELAGFQESAAGVERRMESLVAQEAGRESRLSEQQVIGLTLDGFIGMAGRGLRADWILIDEAAYAPIAKVLPLLSLKAPIAMFGDHRQLPPVCEADSERTDISAYWEQSAIHLETAWKSPESYEAIAGSDTPPFETLAMSSITESFRYGDAFAKVLDEFVYRIGLRGRAATGTVITTVEVEPDRKKPEKKRVHEAEAHAVLDLLSEIVEPAKEESVVVLTPYKNQAALIRSMIRARRGILQGVEVLNTHRAQGREWDTVVFSAVDGSRWDCRPYFTDSSRAEGREVMNTTLSRVRKHLILVVERGFWSSRRDQLLGRLAGLGLARGGPCDMH